VLVSEPALASGLLAECVLNISEGRRLPVIDEAVGAGADAVLDVHSDAEHNRSVLTLGGPLDTVDQAARRVAEVAVARIDLRTHSGAHPRFGAADVVPFVAPFAPWAAPPPHGVITARDRFARWAGTELGLPCFLYGPERSLPDVRRRAFGPLRPDTGPIARHPTAGACAVGARPVLVAYNLWISALPGNPDGDDRALPTARAAARELRGPGLRTLGLAIGRGAQVSLNLVGPDAPSLGDLYDRVAARAEASGCAVERAELVGLAPEELVNREPHHRRAELDLAPDRTIESRMAAKGYT
jgi:glutamate formiminotransferase / 5-formyltetrahydrofolate cyclo-ligase